MLQKAEFASWCRSLRLSSETVALIESIRSSQPARATRSSVGNVTGRFPSRKMGVTIQFESHRNELAFIREYEYGDDDVLEYYDQLPSIKLIYTSAKGRRLGVLHTPDFFVIRQRSAGWEECKPEEHLVELASKSPNRYFRDQEGKWRCSPGETHAKNTGLYYRIRSSKEINWTLQRNIEFLDDFHRSDSPTLATDVVAAMLAHTSEGIGLTLEELFGRVDGSISRDVVFMAIANGKLYVNLVVVQAEER